MFPAVVVQLALINEVRKMSVAMLGIISCLLNVASPECSFRDNDAHDDRVFPDGLSRPEA